MQLVVLSMYPSIQLRLPCTPLQDNLSWVPDCSLGPPGFETKVFLNFGMDYVKMHGFHAKPMADLRMGVCLQK